MTTLEVQAPAQKKFSILKTAPVVKSSAEGSKVSVNFSSQSPKSVSIQKSASDRRSSIRKSSAPKEKKVPRILAHYQIFSYVIYALCMIIFLIYLVYIAILLNNPLFYIQYEPVVKLFEYNSYSLICPFMGIIFCICFIIHVKGRVKLEEGDFFGLIGIIIFFSMLMCHDGAGIVRLYKDRLKYLADAHRHNEPYNDTESNMHAWHYAWSTNPICARAHAHAKFHEREGKDKNDPDASHGPAIIKEGDEVNRNPWMLEGATPDKVKEKRGGAKGRHGIAKPNETNPKHESELTVDQTTYAKDCNYSPYSVEKQPSRKWMIMMQKKYKCCGPGGYEAWKERVTDVQKTCRSKNGHYFNKSCAVPFNKYLSERVHTTIYFMFTLVIVFLVIMITSCCHFAAMKYEDTAVVQEYSLLDLTEPEDMPVIVLDVKRRKTVSKLMHSDAVRGILQSSSARVQKDPGHSTHIMPGHFKNISHTLVSTFGKKFVPPRKDTTIEDKAKSRKKVKR